ncbi:MAG TPA: pyridoxamine 5'-phosphate oxidase family protein [Candidatus Limnocylindrales bacterium]|nr:pyridoxamine 5'-phosphate oxidase family protein [Candidatus Limnocylindrales bacterium]
MAVPTPPIAAPAPEPRVRRFLEEESVLWLTATTPDGRPHIVPVWFLWDGEAILVFSKPHAVKVAALRHEPRAMLALGDAEDDFNVGLIEARAELAEEPVPVPPAFVAKYADRMPRGHLDPERFAATYTQAIRLVPTRFLPWHGRSEPRLPQRSWTTRLAVALGSALGRPVARPLARVVSGAA